MRKPRDAVVALGCPVLRRIGAEGSDLGLILTRLSSQNCIDLSEAIRWDFFILYQQYA